MQSNIVLSYCSLHFLFFKANVPFIRSHFIFFSFPLILASNSFEIEIKERYSYVYVCAFMHMMQHRHTHIDAPVNLHSFVLYIKLYFLKVLFFFVWLDWFCSAMNICHNNDWKKLDNNIVVYKNGHIILIKISEAVNVT